MEFSRRAAAPVINLGAPCHPHSPVTGGAEDGLTQFGLSLTERHTFEAAAIIAGHDRANMILADNIGLHDAHGPCCDTGRGPAHAIWATKLQRLNQCRRHAAS